MKTVLQSEASECGLACLAMVADHFEFRIDLSELRRRFTVSLKGASLAQLMRSASVLELSCRPLRLELEELDQLSCPCILHWDLNHYVVLRKVKAGMFGKQQAVIVDPAVGERTLSMEEVSKSFTGVALELTPSERFETRQATKKVAISDLFGRVLGLPAAIFQVLVLALVLELFVLIAPLFNQFVMDEVIVSSDTDLLKILAVAFGLLLFTQSAIGVARTWFLTRWSVDIGLQWSARIMRHLIHLPAQFFEKRHLGDVVSRFNSTGEIQNRLTTLFVESGLDGLMAILALGMMILYSGTLTAVTCTGVLLYSILRIAFYAPFRNASRERLILSAKENSHFMESVRAIVPLKLFGRENERLARWRNLKQDVANRDIKTQKLSMIFKTGDTFISGTRSIAVLYIGALLVIENKMSIGMLTAFLSYSGTFSTRVFGLIDTFISVKMLGMHSERLADIVLEPTEQDRDMDTDLSHIVPSISLKGVSFRYGEGEPWIVRDVNLDIAAGSSIALTGPSGSGKSTLCKIILGLLPPTEGVVLVGGIAIDQIGMRSFRKLVGTVMQDDVLMAGSILENISFFDNEVDMERVKAVARIAAVHDDIVRMPLGYQTLVGDMGSSLSGGQKQRILMARALYKEPQILALDEATSHLDVRNERLVSDALAKMKLTRILVAHRPETIRSTERVVVVERGQVREGPKHADTDMAAA
jgi:ATP-binding cassette subfamily B protein RaxB